MLRKSLNELGYLIHSYRCDDQRLGAVSQRLLSTQKDFLLQLCKAVSFFLSLSLSKSGFPLFHKMNFFLTLSIILLCLANVTNTRSIRYRGRKLFWLCSRNFGCFCTESMFNCAGSTKIRKFTGGGTTFFKQIYLGNTSITSLECAELPIGGVEFLDIRHTLIEQRDACELRRTCSRIKSLKFSGFCEPEDQSEREIGTSNQSESKTFKNFGIKVNSTE